MLSSHSVPLLCVLADCAWDEDEDEGIFYTHKIIGSRVIGAPKSIVTFISGSCAAAAKA